MLLFLLAFRLNPSVYVGIGDQLLPYLTFFYSTQPYNANFDGDEMNIQ